MKSLWPCAYTRTPGMKKRFCFLVAMREGPRCLERVRLIFKGSSDLETESNGKKFIPSKSQVPPFLEITLPTVSFLRKQMYLSLYVPQCLTCRIYSQHYSWVNEWINEWMNKLPEVFPMNLKFTNDGFHLAKLGRKWLQSLFSGSPQESLCHRWRTHIGQVE